LHQLAETEKREKKKFSAVQRCVLFFFI